MEVDSKPIFNLTRSTAVALDVHARETVDSAGPAPLLQNPVAVAVVAAACGAVVFVASLPGAEAVVAAFMAFVLVILAATDLERRIIPNRIVLPAMVIVLIANIAISPGRVTAYVLPAIALGVVFLIPNLIRGSLMGMGDVKLIMLLGAGLGWGAVGAIMVAFLSVFPFAVAALIRGGMAARKTALPFGPFLTFGALVILVVPHLLGSG